MLEKRKVVTWMVVVAVEVVMVVMVQRWYGQESAPSGVGVEVRQPMVAVNINRNNENDQVRLGFYPSPVTIAPPKQRDSVTFSGWS